VSMPAVSAHTHSREVWKGALDIRVV
jgi:hypothetical protein